MSAAKTKAQGIIDENAVGMLPHHLLNPRELMLCPQLFSASLTAHTAKPPSHCSVS